MGISQKCNYMITGFLRVASSSEGNVFEVHPRRGLCRGLTAFYGWRCSIAWLRHTVYPFFRGWTCGLVPPLGHCDPAAVTARVQVSCLVICFRFRWVHAESGSLGPC